MQVNSSVVNRYYTPYQTNKNVKYCAGFTQTEDGKLTPNETTENPGFAEFVDYQEFHKAWMSQNRTNPFQYAKQKDMAATGSDISAVTIAEAEDEGEFLGLTMVPEEGQSVTYGMRAMLSEKSTPDNPIVQVVSNLGGEKVIYNVEVNKVNPNNATQLELFALLSYTDKMGITDGGTFGSHQQLEVYGGNASSIGYCNSFSGADAFLNERFDWEDIMKKMVQVYLDAGVDKQAEDCKTLADFFGTYTENSKSEAENADYAQAIREKIEEIYEKLMSGDTEQTFAIGAQSFTLEEWDEFLAKFDAAEEEIRKMQKEEIEKRTEQNKNTTEKLTTEEISILTSESTMCTYPASNADEEDVRYITSYTKDGIFCRKVGQTEGYEWTISFENEKQYEKVMDFINQFPADYNFRFAAHENFWTDYLNGEIDEEAFLNFMEGTDNGIPNYATIRGGSVFVDTEKMKWAPYLNPLGAKFYTAEELQGYVDEQIKANQSKKLTLEEMIERSYVNARNMKFSFAGEDSIYTFDEFIDRLRETYFSEAV